MKEALARQPVGLAHHQHRQLRLAARPVARAHLPEIAAQREHPARRDPDAEMRQHLGVGQAAPRPRRLEQQRLEPIDVDQTAHEAASPPA